MLYFTLASKAYARNLQYRGAHMVHNIPSAMFGFMYACIWIGLGADYALGDYGTQGIVGYIAFTQASLWVSSFVTNGLGIPHAVRTCHISLDLLRTVHLFCDLMDKEGGHIAYQFVYKSFQIYL
ncbi:hypothetical protein GNF82_18310, partial [Clostridium perfringens]